jgi:acyl-CoA thioester hydrolase
MPPRRGFEARDCSRRTAGRGRRPPQRNAAPRAIHSAAVEHAARDPAVFRWTVRVYFEDTDAAGIVYYANYLKYFERCRTEWLRSLGIDQRELAQRRRLQFVVAEMSVQYLRPARLDDTLTIDAAIAERARSYLVFQQQARRGDELLASARVKVACVDAGRMAPTRLPAALLEQFAALPDPSIA